MNIEGIMHTELVEVCPEDTIAKALKVMEDYRINEMPVVDRERNLIGMIGKPDIYRFLIDPGHYKSCPVDWVMIRSVATAQKEEDVFAIAKRLRENAVVALPVIEATKVIGMITLESILDYFVEKFQ
ncbi:MAG: CBS domain-containing protein [Clostridiaceae bacterium]|nr:CBS domain-containing protein [Clostridiaceae bacterium]